MSNFGLSTWDSKGNRENYFQIFKINFLAQNPKSRSNLRFWGAAVWILGIDFELLSTKIQNRNRISGFDVRFFIFPKPNFWKIEISNFGTESNFVFSSHFDSKISIFRVGTSEKKTPLHCPKSPNKKKKKCFNYQNLPSHLAKYPKYFSNFSSTPIRHTSRKGHE